MIGVRVDAVVLLSMGAGPMREMISCPTRSVICFLLFIYVGADYLRVQIQTLMAKWDLHISKAELIFVACVKHQQVSRAKSNGVYGIFFLL